MPAVFPQMDRNAISAGFFGLHRQGDRIRFDGGTGGFLHLPIAGLSDRGAVINVETE